MYKALDIAEWFIARSQGDYELGMSDELITNLKLQKLLYYAQGCVLALTGKPLFEDDIYAWTHGPVVPEVYHTYKYNKSNGIAWQDDYDTSKIDIQTADILGSVYAEFGQYSAWKLRDMTHSEPPWRDTPINNVIDIKTIREYFEDRQDLVECEEAFKEYLEDGAKSRPITELWEELGL